MSNTGGDVTQLLQEWSEGSEEALSKLMPLVYSELHQMAQSRFRRARVGDTLQPTVLVNEVYLKLVDQKSIHLQSRTQFFGVAAILMRRILVDYVRNRDALKRPPSSLKISLSEDPLATYGDDVDVLALDEALNKLQAIEPRQVRIVEMRFFVGMSNEEVADALEISLSTVKREWSKARETLRCELSDSRETGR